MTTKAPAEARTTARLLELSYAGVDSMIGLWQERTRSEDARALIARSVVDALLDARIHAADYQALDAEVRAGR